MQSITNLKSKNSIAKFYLVGGYVRDYLLGIKSKDIDLAVEIESYDKMKECLLQQGINIFQERPEYLTIRGTHPDYGPVDYVLCRKDGIYYDNRHPSEVEVGTIYEDLKRRDFTINAIAINLDTQEIIDPYHGQQDLKNKIIKCVGSPSERFQEDCLRILRAIRFTIKYGLTIDQQTKTAMFETKDLLYTLPEDRVRDELYKCFKINTKRTLELLFEFDLIPIIFENPKYSLWLLPTSKEK